MPPDSDSSSYGALSRLCDCGLRYGFGNGGESGDLEAASAASLTTATVWILGGWHDEVKNRKIWDVSGDTSLIYKAV